VASARLEPQALSAFLQELVRHMAVLILKELPYGVAALG
jgi:hypothetical protein